MITAKEAKKITKQHENLTLTNLEFVEENIRRKAFEGSCCVYLETEDFGSTKEKRDEIINILKENGYKVNLWGLSIEIRWDK